MARAIDILLFLKKEDSYGSDLGYRLVASAGTFDMSEFRTFRYGTHVESITIEELALRNRDVLAQRHEICYIG